MRRWLDTAEKLSLLSLLISLAYRIASNAGAKPLDLVYLAAETGVVLMVAFRRSTDKISPRFLDWCIGFVGTLLPLLVMSTDAPTLPGSGLLMVAGTAVAAGAQLSLGRSFGIVAANRGVKTNGLYLAVRHPMYLGYFLTNTGFLLSNPTGWNASIYVTWAACQFYRISVEEQLLSDDAAYIAFKTRVRYRLLPFVY